MWETVRAAGEAAAADESFGTTTDSWPDLVWIIVIVENIIEQWNEIRLTAETSNNIIYNSRDLGRPMSTHRTDCLDLA